MSRSNCVDIGRSLVYIEPVAAKTDTSPNAKIQALRALRDRPSDPETRTKLDAEFKVEWERARTRLRVAIKNILRAGRVPLGAQPTEAAILYAVSDLDVITPWAQWGAGRSLARVVLGELIGSRVGAVTTGEAVIIGYSAGSEIYGLRSNTQAAA